MDIENSKNTANFTLLFTFVQTAAIIRIQNLAGFINRTYWLSPGRTIYSRPQKTKNAGSYNIVVA